MDELSAKAQKGTLTPEERAELDEYIRVDLNSRSCDRRPGCRSSGRTCPHERTIERRVRRRARYRCEYCRLPQSAARVRHQVDHIIAEQHEGGDEPSNLALACIHATATRALTSPDSTR